MSGNLNHVKPRDSEARHPCPSLVGEDLGDNRDVIAGWNKGVIKQAPTSRKTDFEVLENFKNLLKLRICKLFLTGSTYCRDRKIANTLKTIKLILTGSTPRRDRKISNTLLYFVDFVLNKRHKFFLDIKIIKHRGLEIKQFRLNFVNVYTLLLQENPILEVELREKALEMGKLDALDHSLKTTNIGDITYVGSSIDDDFDSVDGDDDVAPESVFDLTEAESNELLENSEGENDIITKNKEKSKRTHASRRKAAALKRQLTSDSSTGSKINVGGAGAPQDSKRARGNGSTPQDKDKQKSEKGKKEDDDKKRREKKEKEEAEWAEIVRNTMRVDVKASNGTKLTEVDFERINEQCTGVMMRLKIPARGNWTIGRRGVAQYSVWFRVFNQNTIDTMKKVIPEIDPKYKKIQLQITNMKSSDLESVNPSH